MAQPSRRVAIDIRGGTFVKVLALLALTWCALQLTHIVLLLIVAILLAVALDAPVAWLERHGLSRAPATILVTGLLLAVTVAFLWATWSTLANEWEYMTSRLTSLARTARDSLPAWVPLSSAAGAGSPDALQSVALRVAGSVATAVTFVVLGYVVTIYLLIEAQQTVRWVVAFFPARMRPRVQATLSESRGVIYAYVKGNVITSAIATAWTYVWLLVLDVPAALLLAVIAGIADFVPVIGFFASLVPAAALAATVSGRTAAWVVVLYVVYNTIENYVISPWAYGRQLRLSDLAVLLAFVIGAELAGVTGALIALPLAALYPSIERLWLREQLPAETVGEHRELASRGT